jgi:hypothetical protein
MAIIRSGQGNDVCLAVDPTYDAIHGSFRAPEGGGGYYRTTLLSGTITALAAGSIFYAFQNPTTNNGLCVVTNVNVGFRAIAGNTSNSFIVSMYATRSYTVLETTGIATAPSLKGDVMTSARSTQMNARLRISNTGAISGGTGTDDAQPLASAIFTHPGAVSNLGLYSVPLFQQAAGTSSSGLSTLGGGSTGTGGAGGIGTWLHPLVLAPGEGFRLRTNTAALAGSDTFVAYVDVDWFEPTSF